MNAARRSKRRRDWPRGLYESRPGYFVWRHPEGHSLAVGRVPLAVAINEAQGANAKMQAQRPGLVERLSGEANTVAALVAKMEAPENKNTAKSVRSMDRKIVAALGDVVCLHLTVTRCADAIEAEARDVGARSAQALRSRLMAVCRKGVRMGWLDSNPAEVTEAPKVMTQRGRLTLDTFRAIHARAAEVAEWLPHAMMLALVTGQDRSTIAAMERSHVADGYLTVWRSKTRKTNQPVAIPLALRLDAVGVSLAELVAHRTGVVSRYLVHHVNVWGNAPAGSPVFDDRISKAFTAARALAGIPDEKAPTFHEIRSLAKRLYLAQGKVDTKALLGHSTEKMGDLYADPRGVEAIRVSVG